MKYNLPVGYHDFHKNNLLNFQLNRFHCMGFLSYDLVDNIATQIHDFSSCKKVFYEQSLKTLKNNNYMATACLLRAAEFFALSTDPDKAKLYTECIKMYKLAYQNEPLVYDKVKYDTGYLPVVRVKSTTIKKGTIVMHGGYDSFIEEFYPFMKVLTDHGYDIIAFEGPGQGGALNIYKLHMTHEWEKPVSAILNHYDLKDVSLIGISLGGYLAARAAAYEKRINKVVLYDIVYDFYEALLSKSPLSLRLALQHNLNKDNSKFWNKLSDKISANLFAQWLINQGYHIFGVNTLPDYYRTIKKYHTKDISKHLTQDVLLLAGEEDIYTKFMSKQQKALTNAKSVTSRVFTKAENASHHCQVGNIALVLDYIISFLERD